MSGNTNPENQIAPALFESEFTSLGANATTLVNQKILTSYGLLQYTPQWFLGGEITKTIFEKVVDFNALISHIVILATDDLRSAMVGISLSILDEAGPLDNNEIIVNYLGQNNSWGSFNNGNGLNVNSSVTFKSWFNANQGLLIDPVYRDISLITSNITATNTDVATDGVYCDVFVFGTLLHE